MGGDGHEGFFVLAIVFMKNLLLAIRLMEFFSNFKVVSRLLSPPGTTL
jgi:hypothetical protein